MQARNVFKPTIPWLCCIFISTLIPTQYLKKTTKPNIQHIKAASEYWQEVSKAAIIFLFRVVLGSTCF